MSQLKYQNVRAKFSYDSELCPQILSTFIGEDVSFVIRVNSIQPRVNAVLDFQVTKSFKELRHEEFAVLGQFCAEIIT